MKPKGSIVVAGHLCLDLIPDLSQISRDQFGVLFKPGHLLTAGPAMFSTGGPVSNTGLALTRLGNSVELMALVGCDPFAEIVRGVVRSFGAHLADRIISDPRSATSYTVIINPPEIDRIFLHCPGANDAFGPENIDLEVVEKAALFHFGYPPLMKRMYENNGAELLQIMKQAKMTGVTTSLDMTLPDPESAAGKADWRHILGEVLPYTDIFLPSIEELLFTLHRPVYQRLTSQANGGSILPLVTAGMLSELSQDLLENGVKLAGIKLGARGMYLRTGSEAQLHKMGRAAPRNHTLWADRELWAPCFKVKVVGTTGAGDAAIAGFLSSILRDLTPENTLKMAVAVGACNVEAPDALGGLRSWEETRQRVEAGWQQQELSVDAPGWSYDAQAGLWYGAADQNE